MAVGADQDQVGQLVLNFPGEMEWHPVMDVDVALAKFTVCLLEVETACLARDSAA